VEPDRLHGLLTTTAALDDKIQAYEPVSKKYIGRYPTIPGRWRGFYENLVDAVRRKGELAVKPEQSRDGIRVVELARDSNERGRTIPWS